MTRAPTTAARVAVQRQLVAPPRHMGVTSMQREVFRNMLFGRMLPLVRSGRMNRNILEGYRTELRSAVLPAWIASDVRLVLDGLTQVVEQPRYREEASLAGDLGDFTGILDWASDAVSDVWGGVKEFGRETIIPSLPEWIAGKPESPAGPVLLPPYDPKVTPITTAPAAPTVPETLLPQRRPGGLPMWGWALLAGGAYMLFRR